jgi:hypothetical protein
MQAYTFILGLPLFSPLYYIVFMLSFTKQVVELQFINAPFTEDIKNIFTLS